MKMQLTNYTLCAITTGEPVSDELRELFDSALMRHGYYCQVDQLGNPQPEYYLVGTANGKSVRTKGLLHSGFEPCETLNLDEIGKPVVREPWPHGRFVVDEAGDQYYID